jgi:hypothetical protein
MFFRPFVLAMAPLSVRSLVPIFDERFVVVAPFALEPNGGRRTAFLSEGIDGDDVVTARRFAGCLVFE